MTDPRADERPLVVISDLHLGRPDMVATGSELDEIVGSAGIAGHAAKMRNQRAKGHATGGARVGAERRRVRVALADRGALHAHRLPRLAPRRELVLILSQAVPTLAQQLLLKRARRNSTPSTRRRGPVVFN